MGSAPSNALDPSRIPSEVPIAIVMQALDPHHNCRANMGKLCLPCRKASSHATPLTTKLKTSQCRLRKSGVGNSIHNRQHNADVGRDEPHHHHQHYIGSAAACMPCSSKARPALAGGRSSTSSRLTEAQGPQTELQCVLIQEPSLTTNWNAKRNPLQ